MDGELLNLRIRQWRRKEEERLAEYEDWSLPNLARTILDFSDDARRTHHKEGREEILADIRTMATALCIRLEAPLKDLKTPLEQDNDPNYRKPLCGLHELVNEPLNEPVPQELSQSPMAQTISVNDLACMIYVEARGTLFPKAAFKMAEDFLAELEWRRSLGK